MTSASPILKVRSSLKNLSPNEIVQFPKILWGEIFFLLPIQKHLNIYKSHDLNAISRAMVTWSVHYRECDQRLGYGNVNVPEGTHRTPRSPPPPSFSSFPQLGPSIYFLDRV